MLARKGSAGMSDATQVLQPDDSGVHTSDEGCVWPARARASDGFSILPYIPRWTRHPRSGALQGIHAADTIGHQKAAAFSGQSNCLSHEGPIRRCDGGLLLSSQLHVVHASMVNVSFMQLVC